MQKLIIIAVKDKRKVDPIIIIKIIKYFVEGLSLNSIGLKG